MRECAKSCGRMVVAALLLAVTSMGVVVAEESEGKQRPAEDPAALAGRIEALITQLPDAALDPMTGGPGAAARHMAATEAAQELEAALGADEKAWKAARPGLEALLEKTKSADVARLVLKILLTDPKAAGPGAARRHLEENGGHFDSNLLVKALERGIEEAIPHLEKLCEAPRRGMVNIYPAAALAMRGREAGRAVLELVMNKPTLARTRPHTWFAAAAGLRFLGDQDAFRRAVNTARPEVQRRLAGRDGVRSAAWYVIGIDYFHRAVSEGRPVSVAFMSDPVTAHVRARIGEYRTKERVLVLLGSM